jgi:Ca-activated chloride channel family protein
MKRLLVYAVAACLAAGFVGVAAQQPTFRTKGDVVPVFVTVTDRDGRLVTDLTKDDFEVRDEGDPQPITQFDNSPQPIRLVVMLDVSGSMEGNLQLLRDAGVQLFLRLRDDDVARVGTFGNEVTISPEFTNNPSVLTAALPETIRPDAPTPLWQAIDKAIDAFGDDTGTRRVILVLSDGKDTGFQQLHFKDRPPSQAEVIDRARTEDVMIYAVGMRSRSRQPPAFGAGAAGLRAMLVEDLPDPGLARVAEETGGGYVEIRGGEDLGASFAAVADELHGQYLLGYVTPKHDGKKHDIDVKVKARGLKPRARKSYVAPRT